MDPYQLVLAVASLVSATSAGFILAQSPRRRATLLAALLPGSAAYWAFCEFAWNGAEDAQAALHWMRLSGPGWAFLGALVTHLLIRHLDDHRHPALDPWVRRLRRALGLAYATAGVTLLLTWFTPWVHGQPYSVPWGWSYRPGPGLLAFYAVTIAITLIPFGTVAQIYRLRQSAAEALQRRWVWLGIATPISFITVTDIALPLLEIPFPRLGSTSYTLLGLIVAWNAFYYGVSFISPTRFSNEILETLHDGVALLNREERIRRANAGLAHLTGYAPDRLIGMHVSEILGPDFLDPSREINGSRGELTRASGETISVSVSTAVPRDRRGNPVGVVVVVRDVREVEGLRRRVITQARLAAVGELAAGVAHEINNPIAFVRANLALLQKHWKTLCDEADFGDRAAQLAELAGEGAELIDESLEGVDRAAEIVRGVKTFTHAGTAARQPADLNQLLDDALGMARVQFDSRAISVVRDFAALPPVRCAPQKLRQVFLNLIINAAHALEQSGTIRLVTRVDQDLVTVRVQDDGHGIPPGIIDRIFDPFFTTKGAGEGSGLGLGIAYQIVNGHGGVMTVDSSPGYGSTFSVHIPLG
jgi:PAS domain S-box-containing protein